jgi:HEAT repeat protein
MREAGQPLIPALESLLATGTDKVRAEVCYALGYIGGPAATLLLSKCLSDPEAMVRHSALRGLERLKLPIDQLRGLLLPHKDDADPVIATIVAAVLAAAEASQNPVK